MSQLRVGIGHLATRRYVHGPVRASFVVDGHHLELGERTIRRHRTLLGMENRSLRPCQSDGPPCGQRTDVIHDECALGAKCQDTTQAYWSALTPAQAPCGHETQSSSRARRIPRINGQAAGYVASGPSGPQVPVASRRKVNLVRNQARQEEEGGIAAPSRASRHRRAGLNWPGSPRADAGPAFRVFFGVSGEAGKFS